MSLRVAGSWNGWAGDTIVELSDGSFWQQSRYHYEYRYAYRPEVTIDNGSMMVAGMSRAIPVTRVVGAARKQINGAWQGWSGDTVIELTDGSVWKQDEYLYEYRYSYSPWVVIVDGKMQVEDMSRPVRVRKVR